jgi:hypothetical protein
MSGMHESISGCIYLFQFKFLPKIDQTGIENTITKVRCSEVTQWAVSPQYHTLIKFNHDSNYLGDEFISFSQVIIA